MDITHVTGNATGMSKMMRTKTGHLIQTVNNFLFRSGGYHLIFTFIFDTLKRHVNDRKYVVLRLILRQ